MAVNVAFQGVMDIDLDQRITEADLVSIRAQVQRYTGKVYTNKYWIVGQEQPDGSFDMHITTRSWNTSRGKTSDPVQFSTVPENLKGLSGEQAIAIIADFNFQAEKLERENRYNTWPNVTLEYPQDNWATRMLRKVKEVRPNSKAPRQDFGIFTALSEDGHVDADRISRPQLANPASVLALPAPQSKKEPQ